MITNVISLARKRGYQQGLFVGAGWSFVFTAAAGLILAVTL